MKKESKQFEECAELLEHLLKEEEKYDIKNPLTYKNFINKCDTELKKLTDVLNIIKQNGQTAYLLGASTKGNCVLQYCNINENYVKYAVERNPEKIGRCTSTGVEIIGEETMRNSPPDYLIVLPWHFRDEIIKREHKFLENGGKLIFYFPNFEIISSKPKTLITGCDGFIGNYVKKEMKHDSLFGITKNNNKNESNILKFFMNMNNYEELERIIEIINPDNIIHLASISSSIDAFNNPIETLKNNGMLTAVLCDIILRVNKNIRLFNASSSEIYKGHQKYFIDENEERSINNTNHLHPYSIAKIMGQNIVKFYRKTHNLHLSNGIIFTSQSKEKSNKFLLNKVANHIKEWNNQSPQEPLVLGDLSSYRNIIHPFDIASAINVILNTDFGDDYCICSNNSYSIFSLVEMLYKKANIELTQKNDNTYYDYNTNKTVLIIEKTNNGLDNSQININASPKKLFNINWDIKYNIDFIMAEMLK